jgi:hypothetical protein
MGKLLKENGTIFFSDQQLGFRLFLSQIRKAPILRKGLRSEIGTRGIGEFRI